ncbi:hypothetical protein LUX39_11305 [Actinomadura madurae]|nr:hypothetical protein [Actinomadura madurae]MCQ0014281.1 hypothetical protein [Actinomadura madurae]
MDLTARLLRAMTDPAPEDEEFRTWYPSLDRLSDEDLGTLMPAAYAVGRGKPFVSTSVRFRVEDEGKQRQPRYTPEACERMFAALVAGLETRKWADLTLGAGALLRCTGPWPDVSAPARTLVGFRLDADRTDQPFALLAVAGLAGEDVLRTTAGRLRDRRSGPIALDELDVVVGLGARERVLLTELDRANSYTSPPPLPDVWERVAPISAYDAFARRALEAAADRARAIQAGEVPFRADKAFTPDEVAALGRAARLMLLRDEPWLPAFFDRLLPGISVAPTEAKSLPSQGLLYEIARAAQDFPTPELVTAFRTVRGSVRHKGVPKQLDKMLKRIEAALAERTEVALRLPGLGFDADGVLRRELSGYTAVVSAARQGGADLREGRQDAEERPRGRPPRPQGRGQGAPRPGQTRRRPARHARTGAGGRLHRGRGPPVRRVARHAGPAPDRRTRGARPDLADRGRPRRPAGRPPGRRRPAGRRRRRPPSGCGTRSGPRRTRCGPGATSSSSGGSGSRSSRRSARSTCSPRPRRRPGPTPTASPRTSSTTGGCSRCSGPAAGPAACSARGTAAARTRRRGRWRRGSGGCASRTSSPTGPGEQEIAGTNRVMVDRRADGAWWEAPLADVPPLVLSEAMRDVDLFVGVTSIAADPMWEDGEARDYWVREWHADLTESTRTRRDALERILPKTKIADRCALDGRHLVVKGELRTYKIHLGSANIVMEPDDAFLCIVPERRTPAAKVFLPFEDERLSLILSKAFLLAADDRIGDESILSQIKRGA